MRIVLVLALSPGCIFLRRDLSRSRATRNSVKLSGLQQNVVFFKDLSTDDTAGAHQTHQCGSRITNFQMQSLVPNVDSSPVCTATCLHEDFAVSGQTGDESMPNVLLWPSPKTASTVSNNRTFLTQTHIMKTTASLRRPRRLANSIPRYLSGI
jgi:hypothetical protein